MVGRFSVILDVFEFILRPISIFVDGRTPDIMDLCCCLLHFFWDFLLFLSGYYRRNTYGQGSPNKCAMVSELEKRYSSDNISSGDKYSQAWNNFFIQYDCCAVREVQGTTNDFDNTPWCTTNGSCHANTSHIPMTCCKDVTQDDYQNAPATCHASVNPGTYRQSCMSRMRELSVVNVRESDVNSLFQYGYTIAIYQIIELFWTMCLAVKLYRKFKKENEKEDKKKMKLLFN
uniref:Uncharacterized protein LOC111125579 isoform X2 n=1 Tax=Crassostrea virginica TaxID=6565 RepID=A0A8B8DAZ8_CRAVI|nr:uncharacterized protein LOC111125579 isoform X2 [Crassostrea virginica]